jgi:hypothetical protein
MQTVSVQTTNNHLVVSQDSEMASNEEILDICPTLVHFVATLEQQFLTIDDLLTKEAINPFMDDILKDIVAVHVSFDKTPLFVLTLMSTHHSTPEPIVPMMIEPCIDWFQCFDSNDEFCATLRRNMDASPVLLHYINDGDGNSNVKREDLFDGSASGLSKILLSLDAMNSKPFEPLWIICCVLCTPSSHETLHLTSQDHGEIFTDQSQKFVDQLSVFDIEENDGYGSDPLVLEC